MAKHKKRRRVNPPPTTKAWSRFDYTGQEFIGTSIGGMTAISVEPDILEHRKNGYTAKRHIIKCRCDICGKIETLRYDTWKNCRNIKFSKGCSDCMRKYTTELLVNGPRRSDGKGYFSKNFKYRKLTKAYSHMISRCYNSNDKAYPDYGGRGIYVCDEWLPSYDPNDKYVGLENFMEWALANGFYLQPKHTPTWDRLSIDRIDVNGPYAPWNCRWVKMDIQALNKRDTYKIFDGESWYYATEYSEQKGFARNHMTTCIQTGWDPDALIYKMNNPELNIRRDYSKNGTYRDGDGFIRVIRRCGAKVCTDLSI